MVDARENTKWDWGQALCRELYGYDWNDNDEFNAISGIPPEEPAPDYIIKKAKEMFVELPDWIAEIR